MVAINNYAMNPSYNKAASLLGKSQTGMNLLQEAQRRGINIEFQQNPGNGVMGYFDPNKDTVVVHSNDPEKMTETLAHELYHAVTKENGNSMNEELAAFLIGEQVAGEAGVDFNPHTNKFWEDHVNRAYGADGLAQDNGALNSLNQLGIDLNAPAAARNYTNNNAVGPANATGGGLEGLGGQFNELMAFLMNLLTGGRTGQDQMLKQQAIMPMQAINTFV